MSLAPLALVCLAVHGSAGDSAGVDPDADRDGLSDFQERHKYFTDPKKADSDGDGVPDGDWDERREFSYSLRAVMHVMAPFDPASMNDDYQDVRVLEQRPDLLEFEVVVYPFNTVGEAIEPDPAWRRPAPGLERWLASGPCGNWDGEMRAALVAQLGQDGIDVAELDDEQTARRVSAWLFGRAAFEDVFTTYAVEFEHGRPRLASSLRASVEKQLGELGRSPEEQWERELFGKGMFEQRVHGHCGSTSIYLSTALKALGLPTRTIVCVPIVDASDAREVAWIRGLVTHHGLRATLLASTQALGSSWSSHVFNEVWVGRRWRRLDQAALGRNVLDRALGLLVRVHTFADYSEAGLVAWGKRAEHPQHAALFGGSNPYSCVSLSDRFGVHSSVPNELPSGLRSLTIERLAWYDDPERPPGLTTTLGDTQGAGHFFAHFDTRGVEPSDALAFWHAADQRFALRARGQDDVPASGCGKFWGKQGAFILRIRPDDYAGMRAGLEYELVWRGDEAMREGGAGPAWKVAPEACLTRSKR